MPIRGREFTPEEELSPTAPRVVIVDERLARRLFSAHPDPEAIEAIAALLSAAERPATVRGMLHRPQT